MNKSRWIIWATVGVVGLGLTLMLSPGHLPRVSARGAVRPPTLLLAQPGSLLPASVSSGTQTSGQPPMLPETTVSLTPAPQAASTQGALPAKNPIPNKGTSPSVK